MKAKSLASLAISVCFVLLFSSHCSSSKADTAKPESARISVEPTRFLTARSVHEAQARQWQDQNPWAPKRAADGTKIKIHVNVPNIPDGDDGKDVDPKNSGGPLCCGCTNGIIHAAVCWYPMGFMFDCYLHPFVPCNFSY